MKTVQKMEQELVSLRKAGQRIKELEASLEAMRQALLSQAEHSATLEAENERITALHSEHQYERSIEVASLALILERTEAERDAMRVDYENACELVAQMHNGATAAIDAAINGEKP